MPQPLLDSYQFIEELFGTKNWNRTLKKEAALLESCFKKMQDKDMRNAAPEVEEEIGYKNVPSPRLISCELNLWTNKKS